MLRKSLKGFFRRDAGIVSEMGKSRNPSTDGNREMRLCGDVSKSEVCNSMFEGVPIPISRAANSSRLVFLKVSGGRRFSAMEPGGVSSAEAHQNLGGPQVQSVQKGDKHKKTPIAGDFQVI